MRNKSLINIFILLLAFLLAASSLASCSPTGNDDDGKLNIITTVFPAYDWVRQVLGDRIDDVNLTLLLDNGVDLHSYQASTEDIIKISTCDMLVYVGASTDDWIDDILKDARNKDMQVVNLMDLLADDLLCAEVNNGESHDHSHGDHEHEDHLEDEHVWLSLKNAKKACADISAKLTVIDPENRSAYEENLAAYSAKLDSLDARFADTVANAKTKTLLFADRFPFIYMTHDYGIEHYAAFSGCSSESQVSFETSAFLSKKIDELGLKYVLTTESEIEGIAETVISESAAKNAQILSMDSMQSKGKADIGNGTTYLSVMESNLAVLQTALN